MHKLQSNYTYCVCVWIDGKVCARAARRCRLQTLRLRDGSVCETINWQRAPAVNDSRCPPAGIINPSPLGIAHSQTDCKINAYCWSNNRIVAAKLIGAGRIHAEYDDCICIESVLDQYMICMIYTHSHGHAVQGGPHRMNTPLTLATNVTKYYECNFYFLTSSFHGFVDTWHLARYTKNDLANFN